MRLRVLTRPQVSSGLSQLGKTADGLRTAYLRLTITGTSLTNTEPAVGFPDLQSLVLTGNDITDLSSLEKLPHLTSVDVSHNKIEQVWGQAGYTAPFLVPRGCTLAMYTVRSYLQPAAHVGAFSAQYAKQQKHMHACVIVATQVLHFKAPEGGSNLRVADVSCNFINLVPDLSRFRRLASLNLDFNQIESLVGE